MINNHLSLFAPLLSVCVAASSMAAQTDWQLLAPNTPPAQRAWMGMGYDLVRGVTVLAAGYQENVGALGDTWEFDGAVWTQVAGATLPNRCCMGLAYVASTGRMVTFGGLSNSFSALGDTLEYDGATWATTAAIGPIPRSYVTLTYDLARDRVIAFGGADDTFTFCFADTWEYDPGAQSWTQVTTSTTPPARAEPGLVYDITRGVVVMYSGWDLATAATLGDTWEYDGVDWTQVALPASPTPRTCFNMVYDALRERTVMHGGIDYNFTATFNDSWEYDGATWVQLTPNNPGPGVVAPGMTHHLATGQTFLFGGTDQNNSDNDDTWTFETVNPAEIHLLGAGCPGSVGVPSLAASGLPWTGDQVGLELSAVPSGPGVAVFVFGLSDTMWNGLPLPLPLTALSMPACNLHLSADLPEAVVYPGATAASALPIPNSASVVGVEVHVQALALDAAAPGGFGALSNALTLLIGSR